MVKLYVKVTPKAKRNTVKKIDETHYRVYVTAPADKGAANRAIITLLATHFDVSRSRIQLIQGLTSRDKVLEITQQ